MNDESRTKKETGNLPVVENPDLICPGKIEIPTEKEQEALGAMKSIKERVRVLKKCLASLNASGCDEDSGEILTVKNELAQLKVNWDSWEEKRKAAARERMIILGHEEGPL